MPFRHVIVGFALIGATSFGCSSAQPVVTAEPEPEPERVDPGPTRMVSEIGGLNEEAMQKAFADMRPDVQACVDRASSDLDVLGGHLTLAIRITEDGRARWAYLRESTLGDRDAEKCVIALALERPWPRPLGGEGLAENAFEVEPAHDPVHIEPNDAKPVVRLVQRKTAACRHGTDGRFVATAYLHPTGRVLAACAAPPDETSEEVVDCIVAEIQKLRFGKLGSKLAKISFAL